MPKHILIFSALAMAGLLAACGGSDYPGEPMPPPPLPVASTIIIDFRKGIDGWSAGVSDYVDGDEPSEAAAGWSKLPPPVGGMGYYLVSHNNSDDVFTFTKRQFGGFVAGAKYNLTFELSYATTAGSGCAGIGGSRGESVYMVGAANTDEPKVVKLADGRYRLNFDHGDQGEPGVQGKVLGTQGIEGLNCDGTDFGTATRKSDEAVAVQADKEGKLWIVLGTDSAFEGTNALYLLGAKVDVKPL